MSDRELLEFAAKAAGMNFHISREWHDNGQFVCNGEYWNPLTDDGDALRLAIELTLDVNVWGGGVTVLYSREHDVEAINESAASDLKAATRRAIVRAAAEIGKSMPDRGSTT